MNKKESMLFEAEGGLVSGSVTGVRAFGVGVGGFCKGITKRVQSGYKVDFLCQPSLQVAQNYGSFVTTSVLISLESRA